MILMAVDGEQAGEVCRFVPVVLDSCIIDIWHMVRTIPFQSFVSHTGSHPQPVRTGSRESTLFTHPLQLRLVFVISDLALSFVVAVRSALSCNHTLLYPGLQQPLCFYRPPQRTSSSPPFDLFVYPGLHRLLPGRPDVKCRLLVVADHGGMD
jgi:hypothetical protein